MKTAFKSFLTPVQAEIDKAWLAEKSIFIFDTNVLLNLYGFEEQTRADFFSTITKLGGKVFLPFHVGLEYNLQRLSVIRNEKKTFRELAAISDRLQDKLSKDLDLLRLRDKFPKVAEHADQLRADIKTAIDKFSTSIEPWNQKQPDVRSEDKILNQIDAFSNGRIGSPPADQLWLDGLFADGAKRYANRIPPGFRDTPKDNDNREPTFSHNGLVYERKYGDLIIWKQILEEARRGEFENIFFVTDDAKEDWWATINSGGEKIIGPHQALRAEIYNIETVNIFHMYSTSDFLTNGGRILNVKINESSIKDAIAKHVTTVEYPIQEQTKPLLSGPSPRIRIRDLMPNGPASPDSKIGPANWKSGVDYTRWVSTKTADEDDIKISSIQRALDSLTHDRAQRELERSIASLIEQRIMDRALQAIGAGEDPAIQDDLETRDENE